MNHDVNGYYPPLGEPPVYRADSVQYGQAGGAAEPAIEQVQQFMPLIQHNRLGETYSVKLVYPGFYLSLTRRNLNSTIGFALAKEKLAKEVQPGHLFFIYVTSPERRIIGLTQAVSAAVFAPEKDYKRPWIVDLIWILGPKMPGVQLADIGLQVKFRVGDSTYAITDEVAATLVDRLQDMASLSQAELARQKERYRMLR